MFACVYALSVDNVNWITCNAQNRKYNKKYIQMLNLWMHAFYCVGPVEVEVTKSNPILRRFLPNTQTKKCKEKQRAVKKFPWLFVFVCAPLRPTTASTILSYLRFKKEGQKRTLVLGNMYRAHMHRTPAHHTIRPSNIYT